AQLEWDESNAFANQLEVLGFELALSDGDGVPAGEGWLALETQSPHRSARWAVPDQAGLVPSDGCAAGNQTNGCTRHIVQTIEGPLPPLHAVARSPSALRKAVPHQFTEVRISAELNGSVDDLGAKFWNLLARASSHLRRQLETSEPLVRVAYTDRYVATPVAA